MIDPVVMDGLFVEGVDILGMSVRCVGCGGRFHQIARNFRNEPPMRGTYLKMVERYRSWGWYAFPEKDWVVGDNVQCPQCGTPYNFSSIVKQIKEFVLSSKPEGGDVTEQSTTESESFEAEVDKRIEDNKRVQDCGIDLVVVGDTDSDDGGIDSNNYGIVDDVQFKVMKMTLGGSTQADIAKACDLSIYMVRQIQNGRKV